MKKDHPHAYGDKFIYVCFVNNGKGSSPRVWGQGDTDIDKENEERIIPTRMGTSKGVGKTFRIPKDHPHAYGDKRKIITLLH